MWVVGWCVVGPRGRQRRRQTVGPRPPGPHPQRAWGQHILWGYPLRAVIISITCVVSCQWSLYLKANIIQNVRKQSGVICSVLWVPILWYSSCERLSNKKVSLSAWEGFHSFVFSEKYSARFKSPRGLVFFKLTTRRYPRMRVFKNEWLCKLCDERVCLAWVVRMPLGMSRLCLETP